MIRRADDIEPNNDRHRARPSTQNGKNARQDFAIGFRYAEVENISGLSDLVLKKFQNSREKNVLPIRPAYIIWFRFLP